MPQNEKEYYIALERHIELQVEDSIDFGQNLEGDKFLNIFLKYFKFSLKKQ